jgi:hypothetical protein
MNRYQLIGSSLALFTICVIAYSLVHSDEAFGITPYIVLSAFGLLSLYLVIENIMQLQAVDPVVVFSSDGVKAKKQFFEKKNIKSITITHNTDIKEMTIKLQGILFGHPLGIADLAISIAKLTEVIEVFQQRWKEESSPTRGSIDR